MFEFAYFKENIEGIADENCTIYWVDVLYVPS